MNLLTDPLLRVTGDSGAQTMNLPQVLAALGRVDDLRFPGIQRHQEEAFHVFLCYLGGAILARRSYRDPVQGEDFWREGMRQLAGGAGDDAWSLVVTDATRPAFLQPPLGAAEQGKLAFTVASPDNLDLLPTGRNHDLKTARATRAHPDEWVFALVSLQTMSGYYGMGLYGISRMNGGNGSRVIVELVRTLRAGGRWRDAVRRLLDHRGKVLEGPYGYDPQGMVLVWLDPWDGGQSLPLSRLDPFYLEVCRRVRLRGTAAGLSAATLGSTGARINAKEKCGVVGDPWLPIDPTAEVRGVPTPAALTVSAREWGADFFRRLVFSDGLDMSGLCIQAAGWTGDVWLRVSVLVRSQGKTEGFHTHDVLVPGRVQPRVFGPPVVRGPLTGLSKAGIEYAANMKHRVLWPTINTLRYASRDSGTKSNTKWEWGKAIVEAFEREWSDAFFPWLWSASDEEDAEAALVAWARQLRDAGLEALGKAEASLPMHAGRRYKARTTARRVFWSRLLTRFPCLKEERDEHDLA